MTTTSPVQHLAACSDPWCAFCNDLIRRNDSACACIPGRLCGLCEAAGYRNALAGYALRIYPRLCTPADDAREARVHYVAPEAEEGAPDDTCANCGQHVTDRRGQLVTMPAGKSECNGSTYKPEH